MTIDRIILIVIWIITCLLVLFATPRNKIRDAFAIFSFKQMVTWFFGLLVVEFKLIEYPIREFTHASGTSFSFEFFIYPAVCIVFNLKFPENKGMLHKTLWYLFFPSWMTILEVLIEKHTQLIDYINWNGYWTWITLLVTFYMSRIFYLWFNKKQTGGQKTT